MSAPRVDCAARVLYLDQHQAIGRWWTLYEKLPAEIASGQQITAEAEALVTSGVRHLL
jgi:hypothetical protein